MPQIITEGLIQYISTAPGQGGNILDNNFRALNNAIEQIQSLINNPATNTFHFVQGTPLATWTIVHNMGTKPNVTIVDSSGNWCVGEVHYDSLDQLTLTFGGAFAGEAYLNV